MSLPNSGLNFHNYHIQKTYIVFTHKILTYLHNILHAFFFRNLIQMYVVKIVRSTEKINRQLDRKRADPSNLKAVTTTIQINALTLTLQNIWSITA